MKTNQVALNSFYLKINLIITSLLSFIFLNFNHNYSIESFSFTLLALLSTTATLYLIYYIFFRLFFRFKLLTIIFSFIFTLTNILLLADMGIYRIWGFHINGMVVNIIISPASYASLEMTFLSVIYIMLTIILLISIQYFIVKKLNTIKNIQIINKKMNLFLLPILLIFIIYEKLLYAYASFQLNGTITERAKVIPLYQPLTMDVLLIRDFHLKRPILDKSNTKIQQISNLNYPLHSIQIENKEKPNIFIFGVDALRSSIITKETTPNMYEFSKDSINFTKNISGGNNTRFGIFSIFYGINSSYWFAFLNAKRGPVFFDVLSQLNYNISIISSSNLDWPEFKHTTFFNVKKYIKDDFKKSILENDLNAVNYFSQWLKKQKKEKPLFSFVWLDGVHARIAEKQYRVFLPCDFHGDYLTVNKDERVKLFNKYKNAAYAADAKFALFIKTLKSQGLYENSIIILLADHGEEFYEFGSFGHNSAYDLEQVNSPLIIHMPNSQVKEISTMTSSLDIIPTLLNILGVKNDSKDYAHGKDLFANNYTRDCSFVGNWNSNAIVCNKYTIEISNLSMFNTIYDTKSYQKIEDYDKNSVTNILLKALKENSRFLK